MRTKKSSPRKRHSARKLRVTVDPSRLAIAAFERIKSILVRTNHGDRLGAQTTMKELAARASFASRPLPPSYVAAMRIASSLGEPHEFLTAAEMERVAGELQGVPSPKDRTRLIPFCALRGTPVYYCFDPQDPLSRGMPDGLASPATTTGGSDTELAVVECRDGSLKRVAAHFGEWIDAVADEREEELEQAAEMPKGLRDLLLQLGFRFEDPVVGKLVTGDVAAIEELLGPARAARVRGDFNRLFDVTGRAQLTLNLDEFSLMCVVRDGTLAFEAEDVFRWLRTFRDENFFGESFREPSHPDHVRDLRKAAREAPLVLRGVLEMAAHPAHRHTFVHASGWSHRDFYVLARGMGSEENKSTVLRFLNGEPEAVHSFDGRLDAIHASESGVVWGMANRGTVVRFAGGHTRIFDLPAVLGAGTHWNGIGEFRDRILVWGTGALLEFNGESFVSFNPDAQLLSREVVLSLAVGRHELSMLVRGGQVGAVARFDGREWLPIAAGHVLEDDLADYDAWRGVGMLVGTKGQVWRVEAGVPHPVSLARTEDAFIRDGGGPRITVGIRAFDSGMLLASYGGIIVVSATATVFHSARGSNEPVTLVRLGLGGSGRLRESNGEDGKTAVVAAFGPHLWVWNGTAFQVCDMRAW